VLGQISCQEGRRLIQVEIRKGTKHDCDTIREIQRELRRPWRTECSASEYLIAWRGGAAVGCAATALHAEGGYFYGLAVRREWQRQGIGSQLMEARLDALRALQGDYAVALAMFWNSRFFRRHGFAPVKRNLLPASALHHPDLTNPAYARSAAMLRSLEHSRALT
jgi:N-acetylglutamate synthase-like GNAT family acetyltransferase